MNNENFYESGSFPYIEKVELAEDIVFDIISNITAKFYFKLMSPTQDTTELIDKKENGYTKTNYIYLTIPAYILLTFVDPMPIIYNADNNINLLSFTKKQYTIKKGTQFLVEFVGGYGLLDYLNIIGVSLSDEEDQ